MFGAKATKALGHGAIEFGWRGLAAGVLLTATLALAGDRVWVGRFAQDGLDGWQEKVFDGHTAYGLLSEDGRRALRAVGDDPASGLYREIEVDLERTPILTGSWKVVGDLGSPAEGTRGGDDYAGAGWVPAPGHRLFFSGGLAFWRTETISHVWSSAQHRGASWTSAYTQQARMMAVRGKGDATGQWHEGYRNGAADYRAPFGGEPGKVDAVAVMTDTDNTGQRVTAFYGAIRFSTQPEP